MPPSRPDTSLDPVPAAALDGPPRCASCGRPLGVYEPLIAFVNGRARETSRAAEPDIARRAEACYHRDCHGDR